MNTTLFIVWLVAFFCILPSLCNSLLMALCPDYLNVFKHPGDQSYSSRALSKCAGWITATGCLQFVICVALLVWAIIAKPSANANV